MRKRKNFISLGKTIAGIAYILISPPVWSMITGFEIYVFKVLYAYALIAGLTLLESVWLMSNVN